MLLDEESDGYERNGLKLVRTCWACPEQYNVLLDGHMVGYLRLRHGHFTAECPDVWKKLVYEAYPQGDGIFLDEERKEYIDRALDCIASWLEKNNESSG